MASLKDLTDRRAALEQELSEIDEEIRSRHGEVDETLDPDPAKAAPKKAPAAKKT